MKLYNKEKAIISLTSWKARIDTVYKTLFSLLQQCPGFHIVLVLSEEEFPQKEAELPDSLMAIVNNDLIELLWVYKNYKSFKKILFTMDKYRDVPVISADDDCIYTCNYAEELYDTWIENKNCIISRISYMGSGYGMIFPPYCFKHIALAAIEDVDHLSIDCYILALSKILNIEIKYENKEKCVIFHTSKNPINMTRFSKTQHETFIKKMEEKLASYI